MRRSKQLLVYINILNRPLVKHRGYRTNYSSHLLTEFHGCTYSLVAQISPFSYESVYALFFIDQHVKVKPDTCFSLLRILLPILYLLNTHSISKYSKNLKQIKIKSNTSGLFTCLFLSNDKPVYVQLDTLPCSSRRLESTYTLSLSYVKEPFVQQRLLYPVNVSPSSALPFKEAGFPQRNFLFFLSFSYCSVILVTQSLPSLFFHHYFFKAGKILAK